MESLIIDKFKERSKLIDFNNSCVEIEIIVHNEVDEKNFTMKFFVENESEFIKIGNIYYWLTSLQQIKYATVKLNISELMFC